MWGDDNYGEYCRVCGDPVVMLADDFGTLICGCQDSAHGFSRSITQPDGPEVDELGPEYYTNEIERRADEAADEPEG